MTSYIIAIDGPAASGKGTLSRKIADTLSYAHMDTGALYRAVGFEVMNTGGDPENADDAISAAHRLADKIERVQSPSEILDNQAFRQDEVAQAASKVAAQQPVRDVLLDLQRAYAQSPGDIYKGAVLDGRDIGTVVCPDADIKLYVTASTEVRAQRRTKELQSRGLHATYEAVFEDMSERDARDAGRKAAPMKPAKDAVIIDTSTLDPAEMLDKALEIIKQTLQI